MSDATATPKSPAADPAAAGGVAEGAAAPAHGASTPIGALADKLDAKPYSGIPLENRRNWVVPRWLKEVFVGFAVVCVASVAVFKTVQQWNGRLERAKGAVEADDLDPSAAPPFKLPARGGGELELGKLQGKLVLVNFWASWCAPCREEEPSLQQLAAAFDPASFEVVAVSVDEGWEQVDKFFAGRAPSYRVALDASGHTSTAYGTNKFPESYLVDASGKLKLKFVGPRNWLDANMFTLLQELGARRVGGG
jgi:thiol-disulfide isomerase/thioredoxin